VYLKLSGDNQNHSVYMWVLFWHFLCNVNKQENTG